MEQIQNLLLNTNLKLVHFNVFIKIKLLKNIGILDEIYAAIILYIADIFHTFVMFIGKVETFMSLSKN